MFLVAKKYTNSTESMFDSHFWYVIFGKNKPDELRKSYMMDFVLGGQIIVIVTKKKGKKNIKKL